MSVTTDRRRWIAAFSASALGFASGSVEVRAAETEEAVTAAEDLMREHGILRRALLVYSEAASRLARPGAEVPMDALGKTAQLFRSPAQYRELSEEFEELEHRLFGENGFEDALERIAAIEQAFGLADLAALTAPAPKKI